MKQFDVLSVVFWLYSFWFSLILCLFSMILLMRWLIEIFKPTLNPNTCLSPEHQKIDLIYSQNDKTKSFQFLSQHLLPKTLKEKIHICNWIVRLKSIFNFIDFQDLLWFLGDGDFASLNSKKNVEERNCARLFSPLSSMKNRKENL